MPTQLRTTWWRGVGGLCALLVGHLASFAQTAAPSPLQLAEVVSAITNQYPPFLSALIERDIQAGRLRSAQGAFDFNVFARLFGTPAGFYEKSTLDSGFEQFTGLWGSTVFGGYRLTRGDLLPAYDSSRTQAGGESRVGLRVPLLRDGSIDRRRAAVLKAQFDRELADPFIQRQQLDFIRAGTAAYFHWQAAGERLRVAESLFRVAIDRAGALTNQVGIGLLPRIVLTDNQRLIVVREIGVVQTRRRFEGAVLALSLFHRGAGEEPLIAGRERLPAAFPQADAPPHAQVMRDLELALQWRPELGQLRLALNKLDVDRRLARNQLLPNLDAGITANQNLGERRYTDRLGFEMQVGVELRVPLQRSEAKGRMAEVEAQVEQLLNQQRFARDRIRTETLDAFSAVVAAHEQIHQTALNVQLARELQAGEEERLRLGGTDLLSLQLREQASFEAENLAVDALVHYQIAWADYRAATAAELVGRMKLAR